MMVTEEEKKAFEKNEERLWDMAALTAAPTIYQLLQEPEAIFNSNMLLDDVAVEAYKLADALILERRRRLKEVK